MIRSSFAALILLGVIVQTSAFATEMPAAPEPVRKTLPNGLRILCVKDPETPLVSLDVFVRIPAGEESDESAGIGAFVARTLLSSTVSHPGEIITHDINALGGNVVVTREPDWIQLSELTVADKFSDAAYLASDVIQHADFDEDAITDARHQVLEEIDSNNASVFTTAYTNLRRSLYPFEGEGTSTLGTPQSVRKITRSSLLRFHGKFFVPKNLVVVVVGNIDPDRVMKSMEQNFDEFTISKRESQRQPPADAPDPSPPARTPAAVHARMPDLREVCVMAGYRAPSKASSDYAPILVLDALLGGMKSSRLFTNLREKQGLSYELGSFYTPRLRSSDLSAFVYSIPTRDDPATGKPTSQAPLLLEQLLRQVDSFKTVLPTSAELTRAKHFVIGSYKIKHERLEDRANLLGTAEIIAKAGMKVDTNFASYIDAVTVEDVQRVALKYLVHPAISTVEPTAETAGTKTE